ncbi:MAG: hypothetical protein M1826_002854, partial [Phylliscum demangeonii]
ATAGSAPKCPIRFLGRHSAEEVAEYFERHKHEIPRSHEVCVSRYRSNEESIRQLDAKYGNLESMIQELGLKHQSLLPKDPDNAPRGEFVELRTPIKEWARAVSEANDSRNDDLVSEHRPRGRDFGPLLRDVRVGESPSRPWGIRVPIDARLGVHDAPVARDAADGQDSSAHAELLATNTSRSRPPQDVQRTSAPGCLDEPPAKIRDPASPSVKEQKSHGGSSPPQILSSQSHMTFTGPVFIGYPSKDVATILGDITRLN